MGSNPSTFKGAKNPVENVAWEDASAFCKKVSDKAGETVRLPTEAQWEYACRAGTKTRFSYGDDDGYSALGQYAWYAKNSGKSTHPVGQTKPNAWGLYDMHGNVWEWCSDWGCQMYANAETRDPQGPVSGLPYRVLRGGSWRDDPEDCRSAYRFRDSSNHRTYHYGFRVAVDSK
ncbi:MAG: formylglycine-generating enzyme family protein [Planctomycetota bacterium]|nr:formylglycine-generating enzyme family protein [Planctomycetota bacterium]